MTRRQKINLFRIIVAGVLLIAAVLLPVKGIWKAAAFLIPYLVIGYDVLWRSAQNIFHGEVFDENFLMSVATIGAMLTSEYSEGVAVMLFYQTGELFQSCAVGKSRRSIAALMDIRPDHANVMRDGEYAEVDPEDVQPGEMILIKPGERVPLDAVIVEGESSVNTAALTGESAPADVKPGDGIISGSVNLSGVLYAKVKNAYGQSTVARILELVENSADKKARTENFITRFARWYTPTVVGCAVLLAVIPPIISGGGWEGWIHRALTFLVVSCPCALVISVPLSFFGGIGGAANRGILVKGSNSLELLAAVRTVVFDKTGTLTKGSFKVTKVVPNGIRPEAILKYAAGAEAFSSHPIAKAICAEAGAFENGEEVEELAGLGIKAVVDGKHIAVGNLKLMESLGLNAECVHEIGTVVYTSVDGAYAGYIIVSDEVKADSADTIDALHGLGVKKIAILTGDRKNIGEAVAAELGADEVLSELMPADKVSEVERMLRDGTLAFVGDGINDAPVLTRADVGVAMGALGADAAIEAADIVLMDDKPLRLVEAVKIARRTMAIVRQNIVFALTVKVAILILGALGIAGMWLAVFADVGVAVIAILNAMRAMDMRRI